MFSILAISLFLIVVLFLVLQPSSSPYNITEKVQQANVDLFSSYPLSKNGKSPKVKFRDELISFEPELTDDDVNSIESDYVESKTSIQSPIPDYKTTIISPKENIFNIEEHLEEEDEIIEDEVEEIVIDEEFLEKSIVVNKNPSPKPTFIETFKQTESSKRSSKSSKRKTQIHKPSAGPNEVHCKEHCIDKLEYDLSMSIKKLQIHDKFQLPPLQLLQRKCCDEVRQKVPKALPRYNGLRSEYGLSSRQLENRERQKQLVKMKEEMRHKLINEYRQRKIEQNEEVFCQWLKEVSRRKAARETAKKLKPKEAVCPNIITLPSRNIGKSRERPRTANEFVPKTNVKKRRRPHTTHSCVYIEVPQILLERGFDLGNLVVTNSKLFTKNLHLLAIS